MKQPSAIEEARGEGAALRGHRGQVTAAITAMGYPCPVIDWVWMLQAESKGQAR